MHPFSPGMCNETGANVILHFTPRPPQPMLIACLYGEWSDPAGSLLSYAAMTDEPPDEVLASMAL
jgi:hypothetical protein